MIKKQSLWEFSLHWVSRFLVDTLLLRLCYQTAKIFCVKIDNRSIIRAAYIQNQDVGIMKSINKNKDPTYDYSGLFIDDEEL